MFNVIFFSLLLVFSSSFSYAANRMPLESTGLSFVKQAEFVGHLNPDMEMEFTVWLKYRNKAKMEKMLNEIYDPQSPNYQKFLTYQDVEHLFAPKSTVEQKVQQYFINQGMQARIKHHQVYVKAKVFQIEKVFQVRMNRYRLDKRLVFSNASAPTITSDIAKYVLEVTGLNNMVEFETSIRINEQFKYKKTHDLNFIWENFKPKAQPTTTSLNGFTGAQLRTALNVANIPSVNGTEINGAGQTIVIYLWCDGSYSPTQILKDANLFSEANGLPSLDSSNFAIVNPDGTRYTSCAAGSTGSGDEIALDIQAAHTIAPKANIVYVLTSDSSFNAQISGLFALMETLAPHHTIAGFGNANQISNSWGVPTVSYSPALEILFLLAAENGFSFNFATGDYGDLKNKMQSNTPLVYSPSSTSYVTAVGGSSLFVDNNYQYSFETGWGSTRPSGVFIGGAGGGISIFYPMPTWQNPLIGFIAGGYGPIANYTTCGTGHEQCRVTPDVGMLADPFTGFWIYYNNSAKIAGGTSLSTPLFTATLALINQERELLNQGLIGLAAPYLYNNNQRLLETKSLNLIIPPHRIISGAIPAPAGAPLSAFQLHDMIFSWDSSLTIEPEKQFWNDVVGVGSPNLPNFVPLMAGL